MPEESRFWADLESNVHPVRVTANGIYGFIEGEFNGEGKIDPHAPHRAQFAFWVEDLGSGNDLRDIEMLRRMDAKAYPSIEWVVEKVSVRDSARSRASGRVTVHGQTRRFEGDFTASLADGRLVAEGTHLFDMRDFGIMPPKFLWLWIEPQVKVGIRIVARVVRPGTK